MANPTIRREDAQALAEIPLTQNNGAAAARDIKESANTKNVDANKLVSSMAGAVSTGCKQGEEQVQKAKEEVKAQSTQANVQTNQNQRRMGRGSGQS